MYAVRHKISAWYIETQIHTLRNIYEAWNVWKGIMCVNVAKHYLILSLSMANDRNTSAEFQLMAISLVVKLR